MTLLDIQKDKVIQAMMRQRDNFDGSDSKFAASIGISPSVFSRLKKGESTTNVLSDEKIINIGRRLQVQFNHLPDWNVVATPVYITITEQLKMCQELSVGRIFCDKADVGKSTAAKSFMLSNKNVYYVDCSLNKTKRQLVMAIAQLLGVSTKTTYREMFQDMIWVLQSTYKPLIILDEAGDLDYEASLEIKAIWNALEGACGWYMMGADGLRTKIDRNITNKKVGFAELLRRFGGEYLRLSPENNPAEEREFSLAQAEMVLEANLPGKQLKDVMKFRGKHSTVSLTRLKETIIKTKTVGL